MTTVNAAVTKGYTWVQDAQGRCQITKERLNQTAAPVVTLNLSGQVNSDGSDVAASSITAAMLADAVADAVLTAVATVGNTVAATNPIQVSLQLKDIQGNALATYCPVHWWLSDALVTSGDIPPTATIPDQALIYTNGVYVVNIAVSTVAQGITDATGKLYLTFQHNAGAMTRYFNAIVAGKLIQGSQALIWST